MKLLTAFLGIPSSGIVLFCGVANAQIVPDATLPVNSSVTPGCTTCVIEGGTLRGNHVFHSFREFSVPTGGTAWFNNGSNIRSILTRVTGGGASNIDGLIRTNGTANLFFLNPNGIIFGPNARLAVGGSFLATTATHFKFADGSEFSATNPQAPPLLTVNVPLGLQVGTSQPGATIAHSGVLSAPQDLTLIGDRLLVQGGTLQAGGTLTLQAQDTVTLRDSAATPMIASAGQNLLVQGNQGVDIFALNHPNSGLLAGQDITLRSNGAIAGDAHYTAGGNVQIEQLDGTLGSWSSPYDPVIRANGNVSFGNYTGASLHIFAGGAVTANAITINAPDAVNGIVETVSLSDGTPLAINGAARPTLDIRAGVSPIAIGTPGTTGPFPAPAPVLTATPTSANITVNTINVQPAAGQATVYLSNQYQPNLALPGSITVNAITSSQAAGGGQVVIDSRDRLTVNGRINTIAANGKGGGVTLLAVNDLTINTPATATQTFGPAIATTGQIGGGITLKSGNTLNINGNGNRNLFAIASVSVSPLAGSQGEAVTVTGRTIRLSRAGTISTLTNGATSNATAGNITVQATEALIIDGSEISSFVSNNAAGNGGRVTIGAPNLTLQNGGQLLTATLGRGNADALAINTDTLTLSNRSFLGSIVNTPGATGNAGTVNIAARSLTARNASEIFSTTLGAGNASNLNLNVTEAITLDTSSKVQTSIGQDNRPIATGKSGDTTITTARLTLTNGGQIRATTRGPENAGNIRIQADVVAVDGVSDLDANDPSAISNTVLSGSNAAGGDIAINARTVRLTNGGVIVSNTNSRNPDPIKGRAGNVILQGSESVVLDGISASGINSGIRAETFLGGGRGGEISVFTPNLQITNGAQVRTQTNAAGAAGNLTFVVPDAILLAGANTGVFANSTAGSSGNGGRVSLTTQSLIVQDGARIAVDSNGLGAGGDVEVNAQTLVMTNGGQISSNTAGPSAAGNLNLWVGDRAFLSGANTGLFANTLAGAQGAGGNVALVTRQATLQDRARIAVDTDGSGRGGSVQVWADRFEASGGAQVRSKTTSSGNAGNLDFFVTESFILAGDTTGLFASTTPGSSGNSGRIFVDPEQVTIRDRARISVDSQGSGRGGDVLIQANRLTLDNQGVISADTASTQGGNITLQLGDLLLLRRGSRISTNAGTAQAGGDGGNIVVNIPNGFVIGVRSENSDISANAFTGQGGRVQINAQGILGLSFQPQLTPNSDITASSSFGLSGTVELNTPDVDPSKTLSPLPYAPTDPSNQVIQACAPRSGVTARKQNEFVIKGRGGLPDGPDASMFSAVGYALTPLTEPVNPTLGQAPAPIAPMPAPTASLVEAQTWAVGPHGEIFLMATHPTAIADYSSHLPPCPPDHQP